jgi:hypothetical protein
MLHILKFITLLLIQTHFLHVEADPRRTVAAVLEDANYLALARRRPKHEKTETISDVISAQSISSVPHVVSKTTTETGYHKKSKVWPPWPFNLLEKGAKTSQEGDSGIVAASNTYPSAASLFWVRRIIRAEIKLFCHCTTRPHKSASVICLGIL